MARERKLMARRSKRRIGIIDQIARIRERIDQMIDTELRERNLEGIVPAHGAVFFYLFQQEKPVPIKDVVANARRTKSTVTVMLNTLTRYGYILKEVSEEDNRVVYVSLTEKGWAMQSDFEAISDLLLKRVFGDMPKDRRKIIKKVLDEMEVNLNITPE